MKTIRTKILSLLLALVTILSLLPTAAFAASKTGSGIQITQNQAYWSTRLLANGTPYSYRPPLVDGKLVYCMDSGLGYGAISTMPEIPGLMLWKSGHAGVYIGGGYAIEAMGTSKGVVKTKVSDRNWQGWGKLPYIDYREGN